MEEISLHQDQLRPIFESAWEAKISWDPEGWTKEVPDRMLCRDTALSIQKIFGWDILCQKIYIHNSSEVLSKFAQRSNRTILWITNHYSNILPIEQEQVNIDITSKQLEHRWDILFGKKRVVWGNHEQILLFIESMIGKKRYASYHLLNQKVTHQLAVVFHCQPRDIQHYLQTKKIGLKK